MEDRPLTGDVMFQLAAENFVPNRLHSIPQFAGINSPWVNAAAAPFGNHSNIDTVPKVSILTPSRKSFVSVPTVLGTLSKFGFISLLRFRSL